MKYILTESQYTFLKESIIPLSIRRRANEETLEKYITMSEAQYPSPCDDFGDEFEYAHNVIEDALDEFIGDVENNLYDEDYYSDVMDYLRDLCKNLFGDYLMVIYNETCIDKELDE